MPSLEGLASRSTTASTTSNPRLYTTSNPPSLKQFQKLCSQTTNPSLYPLSNTIDKNIPVYDLSTHDITDTNHTTTLQDEWHTILHTGPGVFVLQNFFSSLHNLDSNDNKNLMNETNRIYDTIIANEEANTTTPKKGDHFAASGKNARIWNSFQKHALADPVSFCHYYSNPWLSLVSTAWLGPQYQITAQVNIVKPGGKPQVAHRDYHLGFQSAESSILFPKTMHVASQFLTLQGAVAHSDMPLSSGPTRFLPFSQSFEEGYISYRLPEFVAYFDDHWVSLPLTKGDAVFFNPALFHAAGENITGDVVRSANLLQISSAFGKTMESLDSVRILEKCWGEVLNMFGRDRDRGGGITSATTDAGVTTAADVVVDVVDVAAGGRTLSRELEAVIAAIGIGYPFPTNLDRRPPAAGGMAPEGEVDVLRRAVLEQWSVEKVVRAIRSLKEESMA